MSKCECEHECMYVRTNTSHIHTDTSENEQVHPQQNFIYLDTRNLLLTDNYDLWDMSNLTHPVHMAALRQVVPGNSSRECILE